MRYDELFKVRFDELGKIITGKTPSTKVNQYWDGKIQFITPKDIQINKYVNETDRYITEEGLNSINNILLGEGAVAVSCIGNIGYVGKIIHKAVTNQQLNTIIPNQYYDSDYVYYLMKNSWSLFKSLENQSTTVSIINKSQFSSLEVSVFKEKKKQKAIANILSSLDDKIELNNKMNKNLEELAQTLYKRWFIDFEFPNEDGEPYKSSGGEMVESELGLIPEGWTIDRLNTLAEIERGLSYKGKHLADSGVPMINLGSIKAKGGYNYEKIKYYDGDFKEKNVVNKGDIIIANTDMTASRDILGTPIIVPSIYEGDIIFSHHLYALRRLKISRSYLYYYLKSEIFKSIAENYANGTTVLAIAKNDVEKAPVLVPDNSILKRFSSIVDSLIDFVSNNEIQNITIAKTRDEILPKLLNGEIEVPIEE